MSDRINEYGQPIGKELAGWQPPPWPTAAVMEGHFCRLERLAERHAAELFDEYRRAEREFGARDWTYLAYGPFDSLQTYLDWMRRTCLGRDPVFYALIGGEKTAPRAMGVASYLRIQPEAASVEVGHIHFGRRLQKTPAATEAMYLMMRHAFELGYRRYEWKCDALNQPSREAAQRFGFSFEGVFRNATIYKGRSRDTAWFALTIEDWPALRGAFEQWLSPQNFDGEGKQRQSLSDLTRGLLHSM